MINLQNVDFKTIKNDLITYMKNNGYEDLLESLGSNIDMLASIFSGYGTWMSYKYRQLRKETYLQTARLESSIYNIAKTFGYNINRPSSPIIKIQYNNENSMHLKCGDIIGSYNDKDIVFLEKDKTIEKGDFIYANIGLLFNQKIEYKDILEINIKPNVLNYINNKVFVRINNNIIETSKNVENYIVFNNIVDYSNSIYDTDILIYNKDFFYGYNINLGDEIEIITIETNGLEEIIENDIVLNENFLFYNIENKGTIGDTLYEIKNIVPYYFNTLRRMVTLKDHKYILESNEYLKNIYAMRNDGEPAIYNLSGTGESINIFGKIYNTSNLNLEEIYNLIKNNKNINVELYDNYIEIKTINGRILDDFYIKVNGFDLKLINKGKKPLCCTIMIYYIHKNTIDEPIMLTDYEMNEISKWVYEYKMIGTKLLFIPANVIYKDININVELLDRKYEEDSKNEIYNILSNYELQLDKDFYYGNFIVEVSNITLFDEEKQIYVNPIKYILPNQKIFDIIADGKSYIKFNNVNINIK